MDKLDLDKLRKEKTEKQLNSGVMGIPVQVEGVSQVKEAIDNLYEFLDGQEEYDYDKLHKQLAEINEKLELAPYFRSLEESLQKTSHTTNTHTKSLEKTQTDGFSKLIKAIQLVAENKPVVNVKAVDTVVEYRASDAEVSDNGNVYYGFVHPTGKWYILRQSGTKNASFRYATGGNKYAENWKTKLELDYKQYNEIRL